MAVRKDPVDLLFHPVAVRLISCDWAPGGNPRRPKDDLLITRVPVPATKAMLRDLTVSIARQLSTLTHKEFQRFYSNGAGTTWYQLQVSVGASSQLDKLATGCPEKG